MNHTCSLRGYIGPHAQTDLVLIFCVCVWGCFCFFKLYWSIVSLQCGVIFHCEVNQPYVDIYPLFWGFPSHLGYRRAPSRAPCAAQ